MKNIFHAFIISLFLWACSDSPSTPIETKSETIESTTLNDEPSSFSVNVSGCLEGNEIRAEGTITSEGGKPPKKYAIHYSPSDNAKPVVIAKDLPFDANGYFKFIGKMPDGAPLNLFETGGDIRIVFDDAGSWASVYSGNCEGKDGL